MIGSFVSAGNPHTVQMDDEENTGASQHSDFLSCQRPLKTEVPLQRPSPLGLYLHQAHLQSHQVSSQYEQEKRPY